MQHLVALLPGVFYDMRNAAVNLSDRLFDTSLTKNNKIDEYISKKSKVSYRLSHP